MTDLSRDLRRALETTVKAARDSAELAAADALRRLGVFEQRRPEHLTEARNIIRKRLRAHAKSLGDRLDGADGLPLKRLTEAAAYVQWHRLLFARFLVERDLLRDETGIVVSLADCREEAAMGGAGDEWSIAAGHAARLLPGVFPSDDPVEALALAPEHAKALRDHLRKLDAAVFAADDSLGWTYQFWRAAEKKAVNDSQVKIGAAELPAVTQLFTEPYMVRFLLHNTLGAWWAGKVLLGSPKLAREAEDEAALRAACALPAYAWDYLRFVREDEVWRPAAGIFPSWPKHAADITLLDPCCGSGHFLTEALAGLAALRCAEENLSPANAVIAALHNNLHGLEIDGRCVQIAAFALALTGWRIGGAETKLPVPHVAWVGAPPPLPKPEFVALANGDVELRRGLEALHDLFAHAPLLGSLIEVSGGDLVIPTRIARIEESIAALVEKMRGAEPERAVGALAARGMADAASILARHFVLQVTNVPFLGRGKQDAAMAAYLEGRFESAKSDLATGMLSRMRVLAGRGGTVAAVTPQNWLFLGGYKRMREALLAQASLIVVAVLGEHGFESSAAAGAFTCLSVLTEARPATTTNFTGLDANDAPDPAGKATVLGSGDLRVLRQNPQLGNPDARIATSEASSKKLLADYAISLKGIATGDLSRFVCRFWEIADRADRWELLQEPPTEKATFTSRSGMILWENGAGKLRHFVAERLGDTGVGAWLRGEAAWGRAGIAVAQMRSLPVTLYSGDLFDESTGAIVPKSTEHLPAVWEFVRSEGYAAEVRKIDRSLKVPTLTLLKVPFDLPYWQQIAAKKYPDGLPDPYSDDPTQWLFHGHPRHSASGTELHVALARLAGYVWFAETDLGMRLSAEARARILEAAALPAADADGLLALVPVVGERSLADRLRAYCAAVWGEAWASGTEAALIAAACERAKDKPPKQLTLDVWLRTHAARQHAKLFDDRPFLWWITDGRPDGFTVVANYHRLTRANLERLAYTVLGDWITRLGDDARAEAARVLQSKLACILEGETPYDIFVRWKPLTDQPLGWDPDLDDGVRQNARPFIEAGVLGYDLTHILKAVDRGKDTTSAPWFATFKGERRNDHHTTLEQKRAARASAAA